MRKKLLLLALVASTTIMGAQNTFDVSWLQGTEDATVTIEIGDTVTWTWANTAPHNVTSGDPDAPEGFEQETISMEGFQYSFTFLSVAEIDYLCTIHPGSMFGSITVTERLGVDEKFAVNINYYPNPVTNTLTISSLYDLDNYVVHNVLGKVVGQGVATGNLTTINMAGLANGMYLVTAKSGDLATTFQVVKK